MVDNRPHPLLRKQVLGEDAMTWTQEELSEARTYRRLSLAVWKQWLRFNEVPQWIYYEDFLPALRQAVPDRASHPGFRYVARIMWLSIDAERRERWPNEIDGGLKACYQRAEKAVDWSMPETVEGSWITSDLVQNTLSTWQERLPYKLSVARAVQYIRAAARLGDIGVKA